jgi:hypothetical protein
MGLSACGAASQPSPSGAIASSPTPSPVDTSPPSNTPPVTPTAAPGYNVYDSSALALSFQYPATWMVCASTGLVFVETAHGHSDEGACPQGDGLVGAFLTSGPSPSGVSLVSRDKTNTYLFPAGVQTSDSTVDGYAATKYSAVQEGGQGGGGSTFVEYDVTVNGLAYYFIANVDTVEGKVSADALTTAQWDALIQSITFD